MNVMKSLRKERKMTFYARKVIKHLVILYVTLWALGLQSFAGWRKNMWTSWDQRKFRLQTTKKAFACRRWNIPAGTAPKTAPASTTADFATMRRKVVIAVLSIRNNFVLYRRHLYQRSHRAVRSLSRGEFARSICIWRELESDRRRRVQGML